MRMVSSSSRGWLLCTRPPTNLQDWSPFHRGSDYLWGACVDSSCMFDFIIIKGTSIQVSYFGPRGKQERRSIKWTANDRTSLMIVELNLQRKSG